MAIADLIPIQEVNARRTKEQHSADSRKAGIASGIAKRKKKAMREMLEMCLEMKDKKTGKTYQELVTTGLIKGAMRGDSRNYKAILETLGELKTENEKEKVIEDLTPLAEMLKGKK